MIFHGRSNPVLFIMVHQDDNVKKLLSLSPTAPNPISDPSLRIILWLSPDILLV
jgi:hypothetical protein